MFLRGIVWLPAYVAGDVIYQTLVCGFSHCCHALRGMTPPLPNPLPLPVLTHGGGEGKFFFVFLVWYRVVAGVSCR